MRPLVLFVFARVLRFLTVLIGVASCVCMYMRVAGYACACECAYAYSASLLAGPRN